MLGPDLWFIGMAPSQALLRIGVQMLMSGL